MLTCFNRCLASTIFCVNAFCVVSHFLWNSVGPSSNSLRWLTICTRSLGSRTVLICVHSSTETRHEQRHDCSKSFQAHYLLTE